MLDDAEARVASLPPRSDGRARLVALNTLAWEWRAADPEGALTLAREACTLAGELSDGAAHARSLHTIGVCQLKLGAYGAALEALSEALPLAEAAGEGALQIDVLRDLLKASFYLVDFEAALSHGAAALERCRETGDSEREARVLNEVGTVYGNLNAYEEALEYLLASLRLLEAREEADLAHPLNNLGNVYLELGDGERSLAFYKDALEAYRRSGAGRGEGIALGNVGRAYARLGRHDEAIEALRESVAVFARLDDHGYLAPAYAKLGDAYAGAGDGAEALKHYQRSLALFETLEHKAFLDETLASLGALHLAGGRYAEALPYLTQALSLVEAEGHKGRGYELHHDLAGAYEGLGDAERALTHLKAFHALKEEVFKEASVNRMRVLTLRFEAERARREGEAHRLKNAQLAAAYGELKALHEQLEAQNQILAGLSSRDGLTGLYNRLHLDRKLEDEFSRARRYDHPLSVMICDIDTFKTINDSFSHATGDTVLKTVAHLLKGNTREVDIVARYGGEEFVVVFPETPLESAARVCEKIRHAVENHPWSEVHPDLRVTLSAGISGDLTLLDHEKLLEAADAKLYEAKRLGKNRVCC